MSAYITVEGSEYEYEINRSRFIAVCRRVRSDAQAAEIIAELRRKYKDCTHVCYAYVSGESVRSCDDGEPSGTAGVPILACIRAAQTEETLIAVVRYFGGIKLGAGGLLRAYTHAASTALAGAGRIEVADCEVYRFAFEYAVWKKIEKRTLQSLYKTIGLEYNRTVDVTCATQNGGALIEEVRALTQGKFTAERIGDRTVERKAAAGSRAE